MLRDIHFPVLLRIFCFEMGQQFQFGKHQCISINLSFSGQGIYLPMCLLQEKRILPAQLLKERVTNGKNRARETEILFDTMSFRQISSTRISNKEIVWGSGSARKKVCGLVSESRVNNYCLLSKNTLIINLKLWLPSCDPHRQESIYCSKYHSLQTHRFKSAGIKLHCVLWEEVKVGHHLLAPKDWRRHQLVSGAL